VGDGILVRAGQTALEFGRQDLLRVQRSQARPAETAATDRDAARVKRAQAGDKAVWDEWFNEYYRPLFRYAYLRLRSRPDAEDVVSQVFGEAYRGIGRYRHTGRPLLAWLYRIAHNLIFDRLKSEARRQDLTESSTEIPGEGDEGRILSLDLMDAIEGLTPEQRDVIVLRYYMAMSSHEVGALLGKTQPAVFSLQARALAALRQKLGGGLER
jgi:RNA polymerase sigma-70 factor (ECF subfamily)